MKARPTATTVVTLGIVAALVVWLGTGLQATRQKEMTASCISNLKQIGLALYRYHEKYGSFPPAYIADGAGKPMHSWRVLILPYLEQQDLYEQYRFDEPWDSANNRRLARLMPEVYRCPADFDSTKSTTNYVAVVGRHAVWRGAEAVSLSDAKEHDKIMVVEVADSDIDWMEPRDLGFDDALRGVNTGIKPGISSYHPHLANCLLMDGGAQSLDDNISPRLLGELLRIDVGRGFRTLGNIGVRLSILTLSGDPSPCTTATYDANGKGTSGSDFQF